MFIPQTVDRRVYRPFSVFSSVFGASEGSTSATAVAVFDDRVAGFDTNDGDGGLLPFTISRNIYESELLNGSDDYGYDPAADAVTSGADGIREIKLYDYTFAPGNFGLLNIGTPNQGQPALADHIENGVPPEDFVSEIGTDVLTFYDCAGNPVTYDITGNPGLKASLESSILTRMGQVIGFLIHDQVAGNGANTVYTITELRFGRVVAVDLKGNPAKRGFWVQPVSHDGAGAIISSSAPSSGGMVGRLVLAR